MVCKQVVPEADEHDLQDIAPTETSVADVIDGLGIGSLPVLGVTFHMPPSANASFTVTVDRSQYEATLKGNGSSTQT